MIDPSDNARTINLGDEDVLLDPKMFQFNDATLSDFMEKVSLWYDYYSSKTAKAEELLMLAESKHEELYLEKFLEGKQSGSSDKAADAFARTDLSVKTVQAEVNKYKAAVKHMKEYLKSFDKAHSMATNRGYMIRKEMDKLNTDIYHSRGSGGGGADIDTLINEIVGKNNG